MVFDGYGHGMVALYWLGTLLFFGLLIVLIVLAIRWFLRHDGRPELGSGAPREDPALALLRERFARGEIDAEEYEDRRRRLLGS
jgi:putative membrane protein